MRNIYWMVGAVVLSLWMVGCAEKDDTRAAKIESAKIALDNGLYQEAIDILVPLLDKDANGDVTIDEIEGLLANEKEFEIAQLLASAYIGRAGIDVLLIIDGVKAVQKTASVHNIMQRVAGLIQKSNPFVVAPAFAKSHLKCMEDGNYRALSDVLPEPLTQSHLKDAELGLDILTHLMAVDYLDINPEPKQNAAFLAAVGYAAKVAIEIILATDTNGNNIPDATSAIEDSTADKVELAFDKALAALDQVVALGDVDFGVTFFDNDVIRDTVNDLRSKIRGAEPKATGASLGAYLDDVTSECNDR